LSNTAPNTDARSILSDAQWVPTHLNPARTELQFLWLPRPVHASVAFLTEQDLRDKAPPAAWLKLAELQLAAVPPRPAHYIFHSAFCCSTLLARAFDLPGTAMGLKEPQILNELATLMRARSLPGELLAAVAGLLARPFGSGEAVVVKPSNVANLLADPLLRLDERSKAILLHAPLPRFLRSVARKGMWGRIWSRRLSALLRRDPSPQFGFSEAELFEQTDLQSAALAWLLHRHQFASLLDRYPGRVRLLDSETFLSCREDCLTRIGAHFGVAMDAAAVTASGVFAEHSKQIGQAFSEQDGDGDAGELPPIIEEEIAMIGRWVEALGEHIGLQLEAPGSSI
jgi:hypothetical protein